MNSRLIFRELCQNAEQNSWMIRILTEVEYLLCLYETREKPLPAVLDEVIAELAATLQQQGTLTRQDVMAAEEKLQPLSSEAKEIKMFCVAHAHVDMNWEWGLPETVGVVIDTFQTMLEIMEEYPEFTFSQSQASTYQLIEEYCPSMIPAIKQRIQEGRWELTASTWVEPDKNMAGSEAMARHILYTKRYLSRLFDVDANRLEVDFEPDTFGHSANIPEILQQGGVKYYYHCRGRREGDTKIYRWQAPSGAEILCFEEPYWYSSEIAANIVLPLPKFCKENKTKAFLQIYGVGDHGGGPTRRDIDKLIEMSSWPLMPSIRFSTLHEYFHQLELDREHFPVVQGELNCLFTGCYTSQARLKQANRIGEERLYDAEMLGVWAMQAGDTSVCHANYEKAWQKVLFNQFHDILPGSCIADSCHQALGYFQEALSYGVGNANRAMKYLAGQIATDQFGLSKQPKALANGAGVGYNIMKSRGYGINAGSQDYGFSTTSHGDGTVRVFLLFNTTQYDRQGSVELTLWDWPYPLRMTEIVNLRQEQLPFDVREEGIHYWGHHFARLITCAQVPANGYTCIAVRYSPSRQPLPIAHPEYGQTPDAPLAWHSSFTRPSINTPRVTRIVDQPIVLENEMIRAELAPETMHLVSLVDKRTNARLIDQPSAFFRLIDESDYYKRSAWTTGPYGKVQDINQSCMLRVEDRALDGVQPYVRYVLEFSSSRVETTISLAPHSATLRYSLKVLWREFGEERKTTPLLQFYVPFSYEAAGYRYDIPCGHLDREAVGHDVPAIRYAAPVPSMQKSTISLTTDCKYGYRGVHNSLTVNLLHASYFPDPCPDIGEHTIELGITAIQDIDSQEAVESAVEFAHPIIAYSAPIHAGNLPCEKSFFHVEGGARLIAVKRCEDHAKRIILRLCQEGRGNTAEIRTDAEIQGAWLMDLTEQEATPIAFEAHRLALHLPEHAVRTVCLSFCPEEE